MIFVHATVLEIYEVQSGTSERGTWQKQPVLIETTKKFPTKLYVQAPPINLTKWNLEVGRVYLFQLFLESKEYNGKWYTNLNVADVPTISGTI